MQSRSPPLPSCPPLRPEVGSPGLGRVWLPGARPACHGLPERPGQGRHSQPTHAGESTPEPLTADIVWGGKLQAPPWGITDEVQQEDRKDSGWGHRPDSKQPAARAGVIPKPGDSEGKGARCRQSVDSLDCSLSSDPRPEPADLGSDHEGGASPPGQP